MLNVWMSEQYGRRNIGEETCGQIFPKYMYKQSKLKKKSFFLATLIQQILVSLAIK